jgi:hypothetical protein
MKFIWILAVFVSSISFAEASEVVCFGTGVDKGNLLVLDLNKSEVFVKTASSKNADLSQSNSVDFLAGKTFPFLKVLNGYTRFDLGNQFGGNALLMVEEKFAAGDKDSGNAMIRADGDNGLLYIRFFCKNR